MKIKRAIKKPIEIQFTTYEEVVKMVMKDIRLTPKIGNYEVYATFRTKENDFGEIEEFLVEEIWLQTLEGRMRFTKNDYLIIGVEGEIYPCKIPIFDKTYEVVED